MTWVSSSRLPPHLRAQFSSVAQLPPTLRPPGRLRGCLGKRPPKAEPGEHLETRGDSALPVHLHQQRGRGHTHTHTHTHTYTHTPRARTCAHCTCAHTHAHTAHACTHALSPHTLYMRAHAHFPLTHTHTYTCAHTAHAHALRVRAHTLPPHTHTPPTPAPTALSLVMKPGRCCPWSLIRSADRPAQQSGRLVHLRSQLPVCGVPAHGPAPPPQAVVSGGPGGAAAPAPRRVRTQPGGAFPEPARRPQGCRGHLRPGETGSPSKAMGRPLTLEGSRSLEPCGGRGTASCTLALQQLDTRRPSSEVVCPRPPRQTRKPPALGDQSWAGSGVRNEPPNPATPSPLRKDQRMRPEGEAPGSPRCPPASLFGLSSWEKQHQGVRGRRQTPCAQPPEMCPPPPSRASLVA